VTAAFCLILTFVLGLLVGFLVSKRFVGERYWRDGYLYGFNLAWDENAKLSKAQKEQHLKDIRKRRPKLKLIKGDGK